MPRYSAIGLFCEHVRQEAAGTDTLIGVFPDNVNVPTTPALMPSLGVYVRINLESSFDCGSILVKLVAVDGSTIIENVLTDDLVSKALSDARTTGAPLAGLIARMVASPFPVPQPGRIVIKVTIEKDEFVCGALNVQLETDKSKAA